MSATTEAQWFALLASVLEGLPAVYLIIDIEALGSSFAESAVDFSWATNLLSLFQEMGARGIKTLVKVVLVSYGSPEFARTIENGSGDLVVHVGASMSRHISRRGKARSKISAATSSKTSVRLTMSLTKPTAVTFGRLLRNRDEDGTTRAATFRGIPGAQAVTR